MLIHNRWSWIGWGLRFGWRQWFSTGVLRHIWVTFIGSGCLESASSNFMVFQPISKSSVVSNIFKSCWEYLEPKLVMLQFYSFNLLSLVKFVLQRAVELKYSRTKYYSTLLTHPSQSCFKRDKRTKNESN